MRIGVKEFFGRIAIIIACACVLSYALFHILSLFGEEIETIVVGPTTEQNEVMLDGYIFRDSSLMTAKYSGAVDYLVDDGVRVAVGDTVANVYSEGNLSSIKDTIFEIDKKIALLEKSIADSPRVSELAALNSGATNSYYAIMKQLAAGSMLGVESESEKMLIAMNSAAMVSDEEFDISGTVSALYEAKKSLVGASGESVKINTDKSGYFYTRADGYEGTFTSQVVTTLSGDELYDFIYSTKAVRVPDNCIGKLSENPVWYFAVNISEEYIESFVEGEAYSVDFLGGGGYSINMVLERKLPRLTGEAMLVFRTNIIPEGFGFERRQTVKIKLESTHGIYVPKSAVHRENFENAVYILKGSVVKLRRIEIVYEGTDYYLVLDGEGANEDYIYLKSNDLLVVRGSNLFDGRILD